MTDDVWIKIEPNITLQNLMLRWRKTKGEINSLIKEGVLTAYAYREHRYEWYKNLIYGVPIPSFCGIINNRESQILFMLQDVDVYEQANPGILGCSREIQSVSTSTSHKIDVPPWALSSAGPGSRIAELEAQLAGAQATIAKPQKESGKILDFNDAPRQIPEETIELVLDMHGFAELQTALEGKDARIAELEAQLTAAQETQPTTTVDAAKWENSVRAVLEIWAEIVQGDKTDWKEDECRAALAKRYSDYHTKVHTLAWSLLPGAFKHGRGRPKKNPEKSQQSDNY